MNENKKYYWLKLKEDFFEDDAIEWLEEQKPNGRDYAYFYLKLCLKSLKSNGHLIRQVGDILIPYDNKKLAEMTRMDFDTVTIAMELLKKIGLVKVLDSGELYLTQLEDMVGSESKWAKYKRKERQLSLPENGVLDNVQCVSKKCPDRDRDRDRDRVRSNKEELIFNNLSNNLKEVKERDIEKENEESSILEYVEQVFGRPLGSLETEKIVDWNWANDDLTRFVIDYAVARPAKNVNYINTILNDFHDKGIVTVTQAKEQMDNYQKNKGKVQSDEEVQKIFEDFLNEGK